jgi:hypothetical protein
VNQQEREELLGKWIQPSSDDEVAQQERALRMVDQALAASPLASVAKRVYAKGSYANNTNVRRDSDIDIAVDCHEAIYYESFPSVSPPVVLPQYTGEWTYEKWRKSVVEAVFAQFGDAVDSSGSIALRVPEVAGSRPSIDVVPGFHFRKYSSADATSWYDGAKVYAKSGDSIVNWPAQQLSNGREKNDRTHRRYKNFVRALKSAEKGLVDDGVIGAKPSYMMECLVYNVADSTLSTGGLDTAFRATLVELWAGLSDASIHDTWLEPNERKWALRGAQTWSVEDAREVVIGAWRLLTY